MGITLLVSFAAGLLAFLSPCVLPLVPVYLASVCGPGVLDTRARRSRLTILRHTLAFILGLALVFIAMGVIVGFAGFALNSRAIALNIGGGLLVFAGLYVLASLKFPWLDFGKRLNLSPGGTTGYLRSFLVGVIFSLTCAPCAIALLGGTLALALAAAAWWQGSYILAAFSLGIGVPFVIIGLSFDALAPVIKKLESYHFWLHVASGLLLLIVGLSILGGWLG